MIAALLIYNDLNVVGYNTQNSLKFKVICNTRGYDIYLTWQRQKKIMYCEIKFSLLYDYEYPFVGQIHMLFFLYENDSMKPLLL